MNCSRLLSPSRSFYAGSNSKGRLYRYLLTPIGGTAQFFSIANRKSGSASSSTSFSPSFFLDSLCSWYHRSSDLTQHNKKNHFSSGRKVKKERRNARNKPLLRYLLDELGYNYAKDIQNTIDVSPTFLDIPVDTFKQYREMMISNGLPETILVKYGYAFMRDEFKSFPGQVEMLRYVKDRLKISDNKEINMLLLLNPEFLSLSKDEIERKLNVFQEEIPSADIEDMKKALVHRKGMWWKSENDLRNILRLLKEEYGMSSEELRDWFTEGKSGGLFSEKMLVDGVERKLIFEDVYGKGCFEERKNLRTKLLHRPHLLSLPVSRYYLNINRFMGIFSYKSPSGLDWIGVGILTFSDLDRIETRIDVLYKLLTNGKELKKGVEREYKVLKSRYEEKQKAMEIKYPLEGVVKGHADRDDGNEGNEPANVDDTAIDEPATKSRKVPYNSIDEERLYEDYVKSVRSPRGEKMDGDGGNSYEEMVSRLLREYEEKGKLDILEGVVGHGEWKMRLEEKLGKVGLRMEDLYRELWRESEGLELSHDDAMKIIKSRSMIELQINQAMQKLGVLTVYLGLSKSEASTVRLRLRGFVTYSMEDKVFSLLQLMVPVIERYLIRQNTTRSEEMKFIKETCDGSNHMEEETNEKQKTLGECVEMYRDHPVRRLLRSFIFHDLATFLNEPHARWKEATEQWESSGEKREILDIFGYVVALRPRKGSL